jgi:hypothetical protein
MPTFAKMAVNAAKDADSRAKNHHVLSPFICFDNVILSGFLFDKDKKKPLHYEGLFLVVSIHPIT